MKLSLGLDIGTTSIGFALVDTENGKIIESNSVIFHRKETTNSANKTLTRRLARSSRRLIQRRAQRKKNLRKLLYRYSLIKKDFVNNTKEYIQNNPIENLFYLRSEALKRILSNYELASILYSFGNKRGYSDRYVLDEEDKGTIANAIADNKSKLKNYKTFGEMMWDLHPEKCRNSQGDYSHLATMKDIKSEIKLILQTQRELGNEKITDDFIDEILSEDTYRDGSVSIFYQRPLKEISGQIGLCSYQHHKGYKRASKATYTFLDYIFLEKLHNTPVLYKNEECSLFSVIEDYETALQKFIKNDGNFNTPFIKSLFDKKTLKSLVVKLDKNNASENKILGKDGCSLFKVIEHFNKALSVDTIDDIATILTIYQDSEQKKEQLRKNFSSLLGDAEIDELALLDFKGFGKLSIETMQSMMPLMKNGSTPYDAKKECGFTLITNTQKIDFLPPLNCTQEYISEVLSKKVPSLDIENFIPFYDALGNPVVSRVISVLRKIINQIIVDYGIPDQIVVELARDYNSKKEEKEISKAENANKKYNEQLEKEIQSFGYISNGKNIEKYRYWKEQNEYCLYSGKHINLQDLFTNAVEIEHVLPRSKVFVNAKKNKIVVFKKENQDKGNLYHYEYLKRNGKWDIFVKTVKGIVREKKIKENKAKWLLTENFDHIAKDSYLNDTKYATRLIAKYLGYYLYPSSDIHNTGGKRSVFTLNGKATSFMRKHWGLQKKDEKKDRGNHYHHAVDAIVLAFVTPKIINNISSFFKLKEQGKKVTFQMPYNNFRKDIVDLVEKYEKNKKFVHHHQVIKKNVIAYDNPISTISVDGKEFIKKRENIKEFIEKIQKKMNDKKHSPDEIIDKEVAKIIDNSTDRFIAKNIKTKITEILAMEDEVEKIKSDKINAKNDQDKIETLDAKLQALQDKINAPFVIYRGKKNTPQIVKSFLVLGKGAGIYNHVSNKRDTTVQKRKNKDAIGMELWEKDNKKYCVPLYLHNLWNSSEKFSHSKTKIDNSFKRIAVLYPKTVLMIRRDDKVDYILYVGVSSGPAERFEYKEINKPKKERLSCSVGTLDHISVKKIDIYGNILDN